MTKRTRTILFLTVFSLAGCTPGEVTTLIERLADAGTWLVVAYCAGVAFLMMTIVSGFLLWQRNHPLVQRILAPFLRLTGRETGAALNSPHLKAEMPMYEKALTLQREIDNMLKSNTRMMPGQKDQIKRQTDAMIANIAELLKRLDTVRRLGKTLDGSEREEIEKLDFGLQMRLERMVETLQAVPVNLVKLEMATEDRAVDRLIDNLSETNDAMHDLTDSYRAIQRLSQR